MFLAREFFFYLSSSEGAKCYAAPKGARKLWEVALAIGIALVTELQTALLTIIADLMYKCATR